jgi:hypothetical protein
LTINQFDCPITRKEQKRIETLEASQNINFYVKINRFIFNPSIYLKAKALGKPYGIKLRIVNI